MMLNGGRACQRYAVFRDWQVKRRTLTAPTGIHLSELIINNARLPDGRMYVISL